MTFEEKHEPLTVAELVFTDKIAQATCQRYATGKPYKPLMLWGPPGTAKTTTARVIVRERYRSADYTGAIEEFNASNLSAHDFEKLENIASFLRGNSVDPFILINEFDEFDQAMQGKFRAWMDEHKWVNFIVTTNEQPGVHGVRQKLMPALLSRFERVELAPPSLQDCLPRAQKIMLREGFTVSAQNLQLLLGTFNGDLRDMLPLLEEAVEKLQQKQQKPKPKLQIVPPKTKK